MGSSRFPGKPLAKIYGMPMVGHVFHRTKMCKSLSQTYVATCDTEIYDYIHSIGGQAIMTSPTHERCSDRTAEAVEKIEFTTGHKVSFVVMVQGDEPMIDPKMIDQLIHPVTNNERIQVVNLISKIKNNEEFQSPNNVKLVLDNNNNVIYFSREPIPSTKKFDGKVPMWKQLGLILFERDTLLKYINLESTPLEIIESVDMNRFLEHRIKIKTAATDYETYAVDTKADLQHVEKLMKNDPLVDNYYSY